METNRPGWKISDFRLWMVVISIFLLIFMSIHRYPGF